MAFTKVKELGGIEIQVDTNTGQFTCILGKERVRRKTLTDLEKLISAQVVAQDTLYVRALSPYGGNNIQHVKVVEVVKGGKYGQTQFRLDNRVLSSTSNFYFPDPAVEAALAGIEKEFREEFEAWEAKRTELEAKWWEIVKTKLRPFTPDSFYAEHKKG
jgi:hypothetical protein